MRQHRRCRGDDGFTLPEVLITIAMMGVIMTAIAGALMVAMGPDQQAAERLQASHNGQLLALHLPQDLESASPAVADTAPGAPLTCSGAVAGTNVLRLGWTQTEPSTTTYAVSYRVANEAGEWRLIRFSCINGGAVSRRVVSRDLADGSAATAAVNGSVVSITVTAGTGRQFTVSGSRRTPVDDCRVTNVSLAYAELPRANTSGSLSASVSATVDVVPACTGVGLQLVFSPASAPQVVSLGSTGLQRTIIINPTTYAWTEGDKPFQVRRADGRQLQAPTVTLRVMPVVPPCAVTNMTRSPTTVMHDSAGHLAQNVLVNVSTTGYCGDLELVFQPTGSGATQVLPLGSIAPYTATIDRNAYVWTAGTRVLRVREVANGNEPRTVNLTVTPPPCVVQSVVANPNPVGITGSGRLVQNVQVTVTTTGSCSNLRLRYRPTSNNVTVNLNGGPNTWTTTIPGAGSPGNVRWDTGNHTLTVLIGSNATTPTGTLRVR